MAINPDYILCVVCGTSDASPFDFHQTDADRAEIAAIRADRRAKSERGWTGPQFFSHPTRARLCDAHHAEAARLSLSEVPIQEGLARLRGEG